MKRGVLAAILIIIAIVIFLSIVFGVANNEIKKRGFTFGQVFRSFGGYIQILKDAHKVNWAGHEFEVAYLDNYQYKHSGNRNIKFIENGWYAPSYSLPRSKLLDVNLNQKIKIKIKADFEGEMKSTNENCINNCILTGDYQFIESGIYMIDESGNKQGMRLLGTRENIVQGNIRDKYHFTELTIENTGDEIIVTDDTGFKISYSRDFKSVSTGSGKEQNTGGGYYKTLNPNQKWVLGINCHVNAEGYCKLKVNEIIVE